VVGSAVLYCTGQDDERQAAGCPWIDAVIIVIADLSLPVLALIHPERTTDRISERALLQAKQRGEARNGTALALQSNQTNLPGIT
jgi:hypothetical protein